MIMSDPSETGAQLFDEKERRRLVDEIARIKDVLESFKYGLNFEEFADALFKTIDRQTIAIKQLDDRMAEIQKRMASLEERLNEGIKVRVAGLSSDTADALTSGQEVVIEEPEAPVEVLSDEELATKANREELKIEKKELESKIAKLFEKENEFEEMAMNDPAGADEYNEKARVARGMRTNLEAQLKMIREKLGEM